MLAAASTADGGQLVATSLGLWLPEPGRGSAADRLAPDQQGDLAAAARSAWSRRRERDVVEGAVLIADLPPRRLRLAEPGRVPEVVHARVEGSIRSRHHRTLPGGGAWFVQRKVPGRDGVLLQVRPDPGTDEAALRQVAGSRRAARSS